MGVAEDHWAESQAVVDVLATIDIPKVAPLGAIHVGRDAVSPIAKIRVDAQRHDRRSALLQRLALRPHHDESPSRDNTLVSCCGLAAKTASSAAPRKARTTAAVKRRLRAG